MLELGQKSEKYHKDLSKVINNSNIDKVFIKGKKTLFTYKNLHKSKQGNIIQHKDDIDMILSNIINNNDYLNTISYNFIFFIFIFVGWFNTI